MNLAHYVVAAILSGVAVLTVTAAEPKSRWNSAATVPVTFSQPIGLAYDASEALYITEWIASQETYIDPVGARRFVTAEVCSTSGIAIGRNGVVSVSSHSDGMVHRLSSDGNPNAFVRGLPTPAGFSIGQDGRLLIAERGLNQVLPADASVTTTVAVSRLPTPVGAVECADCTLIISNVFDTMIAVRPDGTQRELTGKLGALAVGVVADGADAVLVPDYAGTSIWRVYRSGSATAVIQELRSPVAMARSPDGPELAVSNWGDGSIRRYRLGGVQ